eukprot:TRINITY_DN4588_c0_g1_i1.p1 TRINITY_DN4588_c0_g1~~TRINITY_DN4588_c0_g1_i1.p1  ORF type:complete len:340 (-),score=135.74 TRINITY_DN4588_c0_g1_i1:126-1145(-)
MEAKCKLMSEEIEASRKRLEDVVASQQELQEELKKRDSQSVPSSPATAPYRHPDQPQPFPISNDTSSSTGGGGGGEELNKSHTQVFLNKEKQTLLTPEVVRKLKNDVQEQLTKTIGVEIEMQQREEELQQQLVAEKEARKTAEDDVALYQEQRDRAISQMKEQQSRFDSQTQELNALKATLDALYDRIQNDEEKIEEEMNKRIALEAALLNLQNNNVSVSSSSQHTNSTDSTPANISTSAEVQNTSSSIQPPSPSLSSSEQEPNNSTQPSDSAPVPAENIPPASNNDNQDTNTNTNESTNETTMEEDNEEDGDVEEEDNKKEGTPSKRSQRRRRRGGRR